MAAAVRILLTADVHSKIENVYRLGMWLQQRRITPDLTLLCGDLVNVNHIHDGFASSIPLSQQLGSSTATVSKSLLEAAELMAKSRRKQEDEEFKLVLEGLRQISPNLLYIPGNHDPATAFPDFHPSPSLSPEAPRDASELEILPLWVRMQAQTGAVNIHKRLVRLAPNLMVAGFGGSVAETRYHDRSSTTYPGYPYSEADLANGVNRVLRSHRHTLPDSALASPIVGKFSKAPRPHAHILVTHCGPAGVGTTDINKTPHAGPMTRLEAGSYNMRDLLSSPFYQGITEPVFTRDGQLRQRPNGNVVTPAASPTASSPRSKTANPFGGILFHTHGHSHSAWGISHLGTIPIINPGPLRDGRFAVVTVEQGSGALAPPWTLSGIEFGVLP
ncbi:hypothetical protein HDU88_008813 [Geranomyces variabilis]|nr:hypothetical protein HDU88_008813 [Geranomyces variabilis]